MALQANLTALCRRSRLETDNQAWFLAARLNVFAGGTMASFAGLFVVNVGMKRFDIRFMARHAKLIILDKLSAFHLGIGSGHGRIILFAPAIGDRATI
jgi:hypothetical protein